MKTKIMVLAVLLVSAVSVALSVEKVSISEDGTLVVEETHEIMRVSNVPREIQHRPEAALKLIRGEKKEEMIRDLIGEVKFYSSFYFPFVVAERSLDNTRITFSQGIWKVENLPPTKREMSSSAVAVIVILIPAISILIASIENRYNKIGISKLLVFFGLVLVAIAVSVPFNGFWDNLGWQWLVLCISVWIVGMVSSFIAAQEVISGFAVVFACFFSPSQSISGGFPFEFLLVFLVVELLSFLIAHFSVEFWNKRRVAKPVHGAGLVP